MPIRLIAFTGNFVCLIYSIAKILLGVSSKPLFITFFRALGYEIPFFISSFIKSWLSFTFWAILFNKSILSHSAPNAIWSVIFVLSSKVTPAFAKPSADIKEYTQGSSITRSAPFSSAAAHLLNLSYIANSPRCT